MKEEPEKHDRDLLLHGRKRNKVLTLQEVQQYGSDSFSDPDYIRLYGLTPAQWYGRGVRLLGRTAVECTRDPLADRIGRDVNMIVASLPAQTKHLVIDPFAGSCNTLFWLLRHIPLSRGIAYEFDQQIYELTKQNIAVLGQAIELRYGDYRSLLKPEELPSDHAIVVFVAPPWGTALDQRKGLDLRRTEPPIMDIISQFEQAFPSRRILFVVQVYEKTSDESRHSVAAALDWTDLKIYFDLNVPGRNHGILLGTKGWNPQKTASHL